MIVPPPLIPLTEAITSLAIGTEYGATGLKIALAEGRLSISRDDFRMVAQSAVDTVCNLGFAGQIALWGSRATDHDPESPISVKSLDQLELGDFLNYRLYIPGYDILWHTGSVNPSDPQSPTPPPELGQAFDAFSDGRCLVNVKLERSSFDKLRSMWRNGALAKFTSDERHAWIKQCHVRDSDKAHQVFRQHPRFDGTNQAEFRKEWKDLRNTSRGRPRKSAS